jgi:hypothetical protein
MSHILSHFSLQTAKWNAWVVVSLLLIWAGVLGCVVSSICGQSFDRKQRLFWVALVVLVPFLGVLSYLPFAFRKEELPHMFIRKAKRPRKRKGSSSGSTES